MITRLRIRLHDRRRGHQVQEETWVEETPVPMEFQGIYPPIRDLVAGYRCHGCGWRVTR